ncbi:MAG: hypothetical protein ABL915_04650 [Gallionella sp.]
MKKILLLVCMTFVMSGCLYSPYDFDGHGYPRGGHGDRGGHGGEHHGHDD